MNRPVPKREWINAYIAGLEQTGYTGRITITLDFNKGGIARTTAMREDDLKLYGLDL